MKHIKIDRNKRLKEEPHTGHNRWHPDIPPILEVAPGEEVALETRDASDGQIKPHMSVEDLFDMDMKAAHPLTGPIFIKGAKMGDLLEIEYLEAHRVHAAGDVLDGAVLARGVHALEDDQQGIVVVRIQPFLQFAERFHARLEVLTRLAGEFDPRWVVGCLGTEPVPKRTDVNGHRIQGYVVSGAGARRASNPPPLHIAGCEPHPQSPAGGRRLYGR